MKAQLYLVNPPARKGYTHERAQSGGVGVARKRKPFEKEVLEVLPHDFLYQAAVAESAGHRVELIDIPLGQIYKPETAVEHVQTRVNRGRAEDADAQVWIGVRFSMPTLPSDLRMANLLKAALPNARVYAFGNVLMTTYHHWISDAGFDYIFYGEPESIIEEALTAVDPTQVRGVIDIQSFVEPEQYDPFDIRAAAEYRRWRKVEDLSTLPRAAWHLLDLDRYAPGGQVKDLALTVPASRGCFMPCTMCAYSLLEGRQMRFRQPTDVVDEIAHLYRTYGIRHLRFRDPNFSANKEHLQEIAQQLIDRQLPIEASAELSLELLDRDLLELMHRAGIRTILTGVESNDPEIMHSIGQNIKISRILEEKVAICRELGIHVYTFFLIGAPEETWHTVQDTVTFAKTLRTESTMTVMTPFPGTAMYWRALYEGLLQHGREMRYADWNSYTATMRTYQLSLREIELARTWARLETYIPYCWKEAGGASLVERIRIAAHLLPRIAWLAAIRPYAAWKLRTETTRPATDRPRRVDVIAGQGLIPVPLLRR